MIHHFCISDTKPEMVDGSHVIPTDQSDFDLSRLLDRLVRRFKVKDAAVLDIHGNVLHVTSDWILLPDDGKTLGRVLNAASTRGLWRLSIFGDDFRCLHRDAQGTVLGQSKTTVMVAHMTRKYIVVGLASEHESASCLYEIKHV